MARWSPLPGYSCLIATLRTLSTTARIHRSTISNAKYLLYYGGHYECVARMCHSARRVG